MLQQCRPLHVFLITFLLLSLTASWPWPPTLEKIEAVILRRQDGSRNDDTSSEATSPSPTRTQAPNSDDSPSNSEDTPSPKRTSTTPSKTDSRGKQNGPSKTSGKSSQTTSIDQRIPPGGIVMITPAAIAAAEYYKIGEKVEFAWNYTSLLVTPTAVDVLVSCNANRATYTISSNATYEPTGRVVWDTKAESTGDGARLLTETYTLVIHDSAEEITAVPKSGHLATFNQFRFGMYFPREYVPRDKWKCATCSGALSDMERQTLKFVFGMCTITIFSFTWFAGGFGVLF